MNRAEILLAIIGGLIVWASLVFLFVVIPWVISKRRRQGKCEFCGSRPAHWVTDCDESDRPMHRHMLCEACDER